MYLVYKRDDGVIEDYVYREKGKVVEIATGGDFRKGYITFSNERFQELFMSRAIKVLKSKPKDKEPQVY